MLAALVLRASLGDTANLGATTPSGSDAQSFAWEFLMTATLLVVIFATATGARAALGAAAVAIGATIALASLVGGPISGASLNPARSLGPDRRLGRARRALDLPARTASRRRPRRVRLRRVAGKLAPLTDCAQRPRIPATGRGEARNERGFGCCF